MQFLRFLFRFDFTALRKAETARQRIAVAELKQCAENPQFPYPLDEFDATTAYAFTRRAE